MESRKLKDFVKEKLLSNPDLSDRFPGSDVKILLLAKALESGVNCSKASGGLLNAYSGKFCQ